MESKYSVLDALIDRTQDEWIGALMIALALALAAQIVFRLVRRRVSDPLLLVTGVVLASNVVAMMLVASYVGWVMSATPRDIPVRPRMSFGEPGRPRGGGGLLLAWRLLRQGDTDHDGRLSADEAAALVHAARGDDAGAADAHDLARTLGGWPEERSWAGLDRPIPANGPPDPASATQNVPQGAPQPLRFRRSRLLSRPSPASPIRDTGDNPPKPARRSNTESASRPAS